MNQKIFDPNPVTIHKLFNNADSLYRIPKYQRPYKWGDDQLSKLWEDLKEAYEFKTESYFLGSIITASPEEQGTSYIDVVDGQQRLTTLMIMFCVIRDKYPDLNNSSSEEDDPSIITIETIKNSIFAQEKYKRLKLQTHEQHYSDFETCILKANTADIQKPTKQQLDIDEPKFKFQNTAAFFVKEFTEMDQALVPDFINYIFNSVQLIRIDCSSKEFAIKLFQILNDRGLDLSNSDLIKSDLLRRVQEVYKDDPESKKHKETIFMEEWKSIEQSIKSFDESLDDMFVLYEYHLLESNPQKSLSEELAKQFKGKDPVAVIQDFKKFVTNYDTYIEKTEDRNILSLKYLRWSIYWKSVLLTAYHVDYPNVKELVYQLMRFYYLYWIAGKNMTSIKQTSFNLIGAIRNKKPIEEISKTLNQKIAQDRVIQLALDALDYDLYGKAWCKPLYCVLEYNSSDTSKIELIELSRDLHIEHIIPLGYKAFAEWNHISNDIFEYWGQSGANLTLLGGAKNIEASNNPFKDKIRIYKGKGYYEDKNTHITSFTITQSIVSDYEAGKFNKDWNIDAIRMRWIWFCEKFEEVFDMDTSDLINKRILVWEDDSKMPFKPQPGLVAISSPEAEQLNKSDLKGVLGFYENIHVMFTYYFVANAKEFIETNKFSGGAVIYTNSKDLSDKMLLLAMGRKKFDEVEAV